MPTMRIRGVPVATTDFAPLGNMTDAGDGTYATWTNAARRGMTTTQWTFDTSSIPGEVLSSQVELRHYESSVADVATITLDGNSITTSTTPVVGSVSYGTNPPASSEAVHTRGNNTRSTTCYIDWCDLVVEYAAPTAPTAGFVSVPNPGTAGQPIQFTDASTGAPTEWVWEFPGGVPASANTKGPHSVVYDTGGDYLVTLTATNAQGSDASTASVVVNAAPTGEVEFWNGLRWVFTSGIWNGSRWVPGAEAKAWNGSRWTPMG